MGVFDLSLTYIIILLNVHRLIILISYIKNETRLVQKTIENDIPIITYRQTRTNVENVIRSAIQFKIRKFTCQHYITLRFV